MSKYQQIAGLIQSRLGAGHYANNTIPGERRLAQEMGVSHMTARKAVQQLISNGILPRRGVGRSSFSSERLRPARSAIHVAFVIPAFDSPAYTLYRVAVENAVAARNGSVSVVSYVDATDPCLTDALDGNFDGIFLTLSGETFPQILRERLRRDHHRIVFLQSTIPDLGVPFVDNGCSSSIDGLVKHLSELNHRQIDCVNTQPHDSVINERLDVWRKSVKKYGLSGTLHDHAVEPFEMPDLRALEVGRQLLASPDCPTAILAATMAAAIGLNRAAWELKLEVGKDLSLCTCDSPEIARLMTPSITTLDAPDMLPFVEQGLEWIATKGKNWKRSMVLAPKKVPILIGESTCAPGSRRRTLRNIL